MALIDTIYNSLVNEVLSEGEIRKDRTGVGTKSIFGYQYKLDLRWGFPLLTTKKVDFEAVKAELFWFLSGSRELSHLPEKYRFIWSPWAIGKEEWSGYPGYVDYIYGKQWTNWRHVDVKSHFPGFGVCDDNNDYHCYGINQIEKVLQELKSNPFSRRLIVTAWNPGEIWGKDLKAPAACHTMFQLYYSASGDLDLQLYQRSADIGIGVPYNIASYALLLHMFAEEIKACPRYFIHSIGDAHIYLNHVDKLKEQITREPYKSPKIEIDPKISFWKLKPENIKLYNYQHHPFIRYPIAV